MEVDNMCETEKHINVLLSRHFNIFSYFIYYTTGKGYTHASIGLSEEEGIFYSFTGFGFRIEKPIRWKTKDKRIKTLMYQIKVDNDTYEKVKGYIGNVKNNQKKYRYTIWGVIMCLLHIPYHVKYRYFCSQFVAEILKDAHILETPVPSYMLLPNSMNNLLQNCSLTKLKYS